MSTSYPDLRFTNFPESVDTFVQMLDIVASDATVLKAYQDAMEAGNVIQASNALNNMTNAVQKILTADKINKIFNSIEALERFLSTDIVPYVTQLQSNWQTEINKFSYIGTYSKTTSYKKRNLVTYSIGSYTYLYICIKDTKNVNPTNTTYWRQLTIVGLRGESGDNMSFLYEWDNQTNYSPQDCVIHANGLWGCLVANVNSAPSSTNPDWQELAHLEAAVYPIQSNEPVGLLVGDFWFQTLGSDL